MVGPRTSFTGAYICLQLLYKCVFGSQSGGFLACPLDGRVRRVLSLMLQHWCLFALDVSKRRRKENFFRNRSFFFVSSREGLKYMWQASCDTRPLSLWAHVQRAPNQRTLLMKITPWRYFFIIKYLKCDFAR